MKGKYPPVKDVTTQEAIIVGELIKPEKKMILFFLEPFDAFYT